MLQRFLQVTDGLYRSGAPSVKDVIKMHKMLGINKIVSLDYAAGNNINKICKMLGIKHIMLPLDGSHQSLLNLMRHNFRKTFLEGGPTLIHCQAGKDRTGFVSAFIKCKYLGCSYEDAMKEAYSLGFGVDVDPLVISTYTKLIKKICNKSDVNNLSIVDNEREYRGDVRDSYLDEGRQMSFAPFLSQVRQYPYDPVYNPLDDFSQTRENFNDKPIIPHADSGTGNAVMVGEYDNAAGIEGSGPTEHSGGFM